MVVRLIVAWVFVRELLRALATPLRFVFHAPRGTHWRRRAERALAAADRDQTSPDPAAILDRRGKGPLFLSCGEASGETHALHLVDAVNRQGGEPRWIAFGGARMRDAGLDVRFPLADYAVMGVIGVFKSAGTICRVYARYIKILREERPAAVVLIDYPGLHVVMAEAAKKRGIPVIHYVAPQYWAWGPWRMQRYRKAVDVTLTILPFEPAFFADAGITSAYVGHPLLDELATNPPTEEAVAAVRERPTLVLMPGSRRHEIDAHLRDMVAVARQMRERHPDLRVVIPHRDERRVQLIHDGLRELDANFVEVQPGSPAAWLRGARAALVKSGTGSLEACLHGCPTVIVYVVNGWFGRFVLRNLLTVPYFASANLCMNAPIVPELAVERPEQWDEVGKRVDRFLGETPERAKCIEDLARLRTRLGEPGASERVARWVTPFASPE